MMTDADKKKLINLEGAAGLYGDLRGRILDVESNLGAEIDGISEAIGNLSNTYATTSALEDGLAAKVSIDSLKNKGNNKTPVYFDANGNATSISYTIEKSVPADAKFTDTTYTAGTGISISNNTVAIDNSVVTTSSLTTALANKADLENGKIKAAQLPSYVDDVLEYANFASFPTTGESGKIYVAIDTKLTYRWSGSAYVKLNDVDLTSYYTKSEADGKFYLKSDAESFKATLKEGAYRDVATVAEVKAYLGIA